MTKQFIVSLRNETGEKLKKLRGNLQPWDQLINKLIESHKHTALVLDINHSPNKSETVLVSGLKGLELKQGDLVKLCCDIGEDEYEYVYATVTRIIGTPIMNEIEAQIYVTIQCEMIDI